MSDSFSISSLSESLSLSSTRSAFRVLFRGPVFVAPLPLVRDGPCLLPAAPVPADTQPRSVDVEAGAALG